MTMTMKTATVQDINYQSLVARNVNQILQARGLKKKYLADAMGVAPQVIARHLTGKAVWSIDDVCNAARFLHVSIETLLKPSLTAVEVLGYEETAAPDWDNGGLKVAGSGFEPETSGL
ncbi:helix-turn-helix domain-containing protein [Bifidobacterium crudilactis]